MTATHGIFVRLSQRENCVLPDIWNLPDEYFFTTLDISKECPGLIETIEKLRNLTGIEIYLGIDEDPVPFSDHVILTSVLANDIEFLNLVTCPLGTFKVISLTRKNGILKFTQPIEVTSKIKVALGLLPCETEEDEQYCHVTYVASCPQMEFPPLKPENYLPGSKECQIAEAYWSTHADNAIPEEGCYSEEYGCMVFSSQEAAEKYLTAMVENGELEPGEYTAAIIPAQPAFRDYVITPPQKAT